MKIKVEKTIDFEDFLCGEDAPILSDDEIKEIVLENHLLKQDVDWEPADMVKIIRSKEEKYIGKESAP
jgi:hypothetical protein